MTFCWFFHHDIVSGKEKGSMMIISQNLSIMIIIIFITMITMSTCHYYCSDSALPPLALRNSTPKLAVAAGKEFSLFAKRGFFGILVSPVVSDGQRTGSPKRMTLNKLFIKC